LGDLKAACAKITNQIFLVLANPHLPSLRALFSTVPAHKDTFAMSMLYELNDSLKAWHMMMVRTLQ
jgi:hypothetical protein